MCQLNLYFVSKNINKQIVLNIMQTNLYYAYPECVSDEDFLLELQEDYNTYISAGMRCNCGTILGMYQNEKEKLPWNQLKQKLIDKERDSLLQAKALLERPDYQELKKTILAKLDTLFEKRKTANLEEHDQIMKEIQALHIDNQAFFTASTRYEHYVDEEKTQIDFSAINKAINKVEDTLFARSDAEYKSLIDFIKTILEETNEVKLYTFWQDGDPLYINKEIVVYHDKLSIEDIIYLNDKTLLTIRKR